jgi:NADH-quinone oxidoreductase subunit I
MKGIGILKGIAITFQHILDTYLEDIKGGRDRYYTEEGVQSRLDADTKGIFTVQYPEERLPSYEETRIVPFLVYDEGENGEKDVRCTACGICTKVCPTQCIWIDRAEDPETGKPMKEPAHFAIDVDLCMNCGFCAEYCPFDAIKMDHDIELANYDRFQENIHHMDRLLKPASYYAEIRPLNYTREQEAKQAKSKKRSRK